MLIAAQGSANFKTQSRRRRLWPLQAGVMVIEVKPQQQALELLQSARIKNK